MVSRFTLVAFGHDPLSRWCVRPVAVVKPPLQKGHSMPWPVCVRDIMCFSRISLLVQQIYGSVSWYNKYQSGKTRPYHSQIVAVDEGPVAIGAIQVVVVLVLDTLFIRWPSLGTVAELTNYIEVIVIPHVVVSCSFTPEVHCTSIALMCRPRMASGAAVVVASFPPGREEPTTTAALVMHLLVMMRRRQWSWQSGRPRLQSLTSVFWLGIRG